MTRGVGRGEELDGLVHRRIGGARICVCACVGESRGVRKYTSKVKQQKDVQMCGGNDETFARFIQSLETDHQADILGLPRPTSSPSRQLVLMTAVLVAILVVILLGRQPG